MKIENSKRQQTTANKYDIHYFHIQTNRRTCKVDLVGNDAEENRSGYKIVCEIMNKEIKRKPSELSGQGKE